MSTRPPVMFSIVTAGCADVLESDARPKILVEPFAARSVEPKVMIPLPPFTWNNGPVAPALDTNVVFVIVVVSIVFCRLIPETPAFCTRTSLMIMSPTPLLKIPLPVGLSMIKPEN